MSIIGGVNVNRMSMPREERAIRRQLDEIISDADEPFQKLVDCKDSSEFGTTEEESKVDEMDLEFEADDFDDIKDESDEEDGFEVKAEEEDDDDAPKLEEENKSLTEVLNEAEQDGDYVDADHRTEDAPSEGSVGEIEH
jgi:hypothetical protein